jgi:hypothetical protein
MPAAPHALSCLLPSVAGSGQAIVGLLRRNIHVPGFGDAEFTPYRRPAASDIHRARQVTRLLTCVSKATAFSAVKCSLDNAATVDTDCAAEQYLWHATRTSSYTACCSSSTQHLTIQPDFDFVVP